MSASSLTLTAPCAGSPVSPPLHCWGQGSRHGLLPHVISPTQPKRGKALLSAQSRVGWGRQLERPGTSAGDSPEVLTVKVLSSPRRIPEVRGSSDRCLPSSRVRGPGLHPDEKKAGSGSGVWRPYEKNPGGSPMGRTRAGFLLTQSKSGLLITPRHPLDETRICRQAEGQSCQPTLPPQYSTMYYVIPGVSDTGKGSREIR